MTRLPGWRVRLLSFLQASARRSFRPGDHDCALFVAGAVEAMTGIDHAATWRGTYRTLTDGQVALRAAGHVDHVELVAALLPEIPPSMAQVGDIAVLPSAIPDEAGALGIIQGPAVYALSPSGLAITSRLQIQRAFQV